MAIYAKRGLVEQGGNQVKDAGVDFWIAYAEKKLGNEIANWDIMAGSMTHPGIVQFHSLVNTLAVLYLARAIESQKAVKEGE